MLRLHQPIKTVISEYCSPKARHRAALCAHGMQGAVELRSKSFIKLHAFFHSPVG